MGRMDSPLARRRRTVMLRWAVPATLIGIVAVGSVAAPVLAGRTPQLPARTAGDLLTALQQAEPQPLAGTITQRADLGLPQLPTGGGGSPSVATLVSGTTTVRVWYGGPEQARVSLVGALAETDLVRDGRDVWLWTSDDNTAVHRTLSDEEAAATAEAPAPTATPLTPQEATAQVLAALEPTTAVSVDGTAQVAGRSAYELVLQPRQDATLVEEVRLAVDSETSLPLRVQVTAVGQTEPSFETGFTSISFTDPPTSIFDFRPPAGAEVTEASGVLPDGPGGPDAAADAGAARPTVVGTGWSSVVVQRDVDVDALTGAAQGSAEAGTLLSALRQVDGPSGSGRGLQTDLLSVLLLDDGRALVGAVPLEELERVAATGAGR